MHIRPHGVGQGGQRGAGLIIAAVAGLQQHGLRALHVQRVAVIAADAAVQLRSGLLGGRDRQHVAPLADGHTADVGAKTILRQHAVGVGGRPGVLAAVPRQLDSIAVRKLIAIPHRKAGDRAVLHDAVDDDVIRHRHIVAGIVKQLLAGGVIQRVGVRRAAVAADELPDDGLRRKLRTVRVHIEAVVAAIAVGHGQRHGVPLVPAQPAPADGGVFGVALGRTHSRLHAIGGHCCAGIVPREIFQLRAGKCTPLGHRRLVLVVAILVAAADGAGDGLGVGRHDGQPHERRQQAHQCQQLWNGFLHAMSFLPTQKAGSIKLSAFWSGIQLVYPYSTTTMYSSDAAS